MTSPQRIVDLIDAGLGHSGGVNAGMGPINSHYCGRTNCKSAPVAGHDFCAACLAWLRFEVDDDPLAKPEPAPPPMVSSFAPAGMVDTEDDDWACALAAIAAATGYCFALLGLFRCIPHGSLLACRRGRRGGWWSWAATILEGRRNR